MGWDGTGQGDWPCTIAMIAMMGRTERKARDVHCRRWVVGASFGGRNRGKIVGGALKDGPKGPKHRRRNCGPL